MMMMRLAVAGYEHFKVGTASALIAAPLVVPVRNILGAKTLYQYAASAPDGMTLHGRAPVYIIPFGADGTKVAVRHAMRGGLFAPLLGDKFFPPTRGLRELVNAMRLRIAGVPTPDVLGVISYSAGGIFRRSDVMTRYIGDSADLAAVFSDARNDEVRRHILDAVVGLLMRMTSAGAQHPDLNLKNILITTNATGYQAMLLDVDRVAFHVPSDPLVARANLERLLRSLKKWSAKPGTRANAISEGDYQYLTLCSHVMVRQ